MLEQGSDYLDTELVSDGMGTPLCDRSYTVELCTQIEKNVHNTIVLFSDCFEFTCT